MAAGRGQNPGRMEFFVVTLLNGISYGLLLFMLSAGLTLIFGLMGVLNFAHAGFYMLGAYVGYSISSWLGYWPALVLAPLVVGLAGAAFERWILRRVHRSGHVAELLVTFGLAYVIVELVQLVWGRGSVPYRLPESLQGALFTLYGTQFPRSRAFVMLVALLMLGALALLLRRSRIGLIVRAARAHPGMVEALGHNLPRVFMLVFGGGSALAGLAGAIGGNTYVTEPHMAEALGPIVFVVVVVGGMGSLTGAFAASLLIGLLQTFAVTLDWSLAGALARAGLAAPGSALGHAVAHLTVSQVAPLLPYLLLILVLVIRPQGLFGMRQN